MSGGGGGGGETTSSTEPWGAVQGHLRELFNRAHDQSFAPTNTAAMSPTDRGAALSQIMGGPGWDASYYSSYGLPGESIVHGAQLGMVPFTRPELAAQGGMINYANSGLPSTFSTGAGGLNDVLQGDWVNQGNSPQLWDTLSGSYLDSGNPHLQGMYQAATRPVIEDFKTELLPAITSQFNAGGRMGSGAQQNVTAAATDDLTRNLADTASNIYGQNYEAERQRMMQGVGLQNQNFQNERERMMRGLSLSPVYAGAQREMDLGNLGLLGQVGAAQREMATQALGLPQQAAMNPWQNLGLYSDMLGQGLGFNTSSSDQDMYQNRLAGALGGAASGAGLGMMFGGPLGAGIGGGAGLLLGGFL